MRITESQLRRMIREAMSVTLNSGEPIDTLEKVKSLQPGDRFKVGAKTGVVLEVQPLVGNLVYADEGASTMKNLDYRFAVRYPNDPQGMKPEIQLTYVGPGAPPSRLRRSPARRSFNPYD